MKSKEPADYMLSQDSIKAFALEADKETFEEREKLQTMEKSRREFAKKLRDTQDQEFKVKQDQNKQDRLRYLLKQSEIFTHFILQNGKKGQGNAAVRQEIEEIKAGRGAPPSSAIGGKSSVSKRHQKKPRRGAEAEMDDFEEDSD